MTEIAETIVPEAEAIAAETSVPTAPEAEKATKHRQMSFAVLESGEIRADFGEGVEPLTLNPAAVPETLQAAAIVEGFISRLRGYTSKLQAAERTPVALRAAIEKGMQNLLAGVWKIERIGGEAEYPLEIEAAFEFRALRAKKLGEDFTGTLAEAAENFGKLSDEQKKKLKETALYQVALANVKARRAAEKAAALAKKADESDEVDF